MNHLISSKFDYKIKPMGKPSAKFFRSLEEAPRSLEVSCLCR